VLSILVASFESEIQDCNSLRLLWGFICRKLIMVGDQMTKVELLCEDTLMILISGEGLLNAHKCDLFFCL